MGTNQQTKELQEAIKGLYRQLGWTMNQLGRVLYTALFDEDNDEDIRRFLERLKKELQRDTTKPERLRKYYEILVRHPDTAKLGLIKLHYEATDAIDREMTLEMSKISKELDRQLMEKPE